MYNRVNFPGSIGMDTRAAAALGLAACALTPIRPPVPNCRVRVFFAALISHEGGRDLRKVYKVY